LKNESGLLGSIRDYSPESPSCSTAPSRLAGYGPEEAAGDLDGVFGSRLAEESFTTYYLSSYINEIAKAGNRSIAGNLRHTWEGGEDTADAFDSFDRAGEGYPSGGPVSHMLDLWKANAPDIDILSATPPCNPSSTSGMIKRALRPSRQSLLEPRGGPDHVGRARVLYALSEYRPLLRRLWRGRRHRSQLTGRF